MSMSISYTETGRTRQKSRTRRELVAAARTLLAQGLDPTVEQAAEAAEVSRATAYRYFPNQRALLTAVFPEIATTSLLPTPPPKEPEARLDVVIAELGRQLIEHEPELRAQLRVSLEPGNEAAVMPFRTGRAIGWIEEALDPLLDQVPASELRRLVLAIRASAGIESFVWLTDVGGVPRKEAAEIMRWSARALLRAVLSDATGEPERLSPSP
ncbi:MAG: TetR/AcrR family transcriptional regulator [Solirubrobacterales bacterium]